MQALNPCATCLHHVALFTYLVLRTASKDLSRTARLLEYHMNIQAKLYTIFPTPSSFLAIFALSVLHRLLLHCFYRSLQLSHPRPNPVLYLLSIRRFDGLFIRLFELRQFLLGGCPVVGCVDGLLFRFLKGYFELVFCCCVAVAVISNTDRARGEDRDSQFL